MLFQSPPFWGLMTTPKICIKIYLVKAQVLNLFETKLPLSVCMIRFAFQMQHVHTRDKLPLNIISIYHHQYGYYDMTGTIPLHTHPCDGDKS